MSREQDLREVHERKIRPRLQSLAEHRGRAKRQALGLFLSAAVLLYGARAVAGLVLGGRSGWMALAVAVMVALGVVAIYRSSGAGGGDFGSYRGRCCLALLVDDRVSPEGGLLGRAFAVLGGLLLARVSESGNR